MSNSYRIRTQVGVDKSIKVYLDQDFEFLEILSLKILQSEIYTRPCSDYGVVIGRVTVNNGFGVPNAKVSIFVPLTLEDQNNPVISTLYPYKIVTDPGEDGHRYNLLPSDKQHGGHTPTGTFPTKEEILKNPTIIEVFDKYFRYTTVTNDSGDYMILGVPLGNQTIHVDLDLSDMGEFSLFPQDLIRMGRATTSQVAGNRFKSSTNLAELPQIVSLNKVIDVSPFWGQEDLCEIGITRTDFDLSEGGLNIKIEPTAIFMGSMISDTEIRALRRNCKPKFKQGELCELTTGPGEILAVRQTIFNDSLGRPILESYSIDQGGQVIDENGTWLIDLPMNLDYVTTNEFGEKVISLDPNVGIATAAKYRFKVKWNQPPSMSENIKRAYFLVPNIREYGWDASGVNVDPIAKDKSYTFSLNWDDYADPQAAINCEDSFYPFKYNKIYTVSQMIDQVRQGTLPNRIVSVKNILDDACQSENYKFPTNDSAFRLDIIFLLFTFAMYVFRPVLWVLLVILHILAFFFPSLADFLYFLALAFLILAIWNFYQMATSYPAVLLILGFLFKALKYTAMSIICYLLADKVKEFKFVGINLPLLLYDQCEFCDCKDPGPVGTSAAAQFSQQANAQAGSGNNTASEFPLATTTGPYKLVPPGNQQNSSISDLMGGKPFGSPPSYPYSCNPRIPELFSKNEGGADYWYFSSSLTLAERINLFNVKAKYFNSSSSNPGAGVNRIQVKINPTGNTPTDLHYDNVTVMLMDKSTLPKLTAGKMVTFQDPKKSRDINVTGATQNDYGNNATTGTTTLLTGATNQITINYSDFNGNPAPPVIYNIPPVNADDANYTKFPTDVEYFQVITAMTISTIAGLLNPAASDRLFTQYIFKDMSYLRLINDTGSPFNNFPAGPLLNVDYPLASLNNYQDLVVVFLVRGVDPYSTRVPIKYDLNWLFGNNFGVNPSLIISGSYKLNVPIQGGFLNVAHDILNNTDTDLSYSNMKLYYDSFSYQITNYSAFTSNYPKYYSRLDGKSPSNYNFQSSCGCSGVYGNSFSVKGVYADTNNDFTREWNNNPPGANYPVQNTFSNQGNRRGYLLNEIVEGGSSMVVYANIAQPGISATPSKTSIYRSIAYSPTVNMNFLAQSNKKTIIMRSDRLPTSTCTQEACGLSMLLQQNENLCMFTIPDVGILDQSPTTGFASSSTGPTDNTPPQNFTNQLVDSCNICQQSVPLDCYTYDNVLNKFVVNHGACEQFNGKYIFKNGCYILVTEAFTSLEKDFKLLNEWISRTNIVFGACRNVWSHLFTNNWINGTLYAFAFKNDRFFTPPTAPNPNQPYSLFCEKVIYYKTSNNNFYYRSTPYYTGGTTNLFVGTNLGNGSTNTYNLLFPTTILDLGPKTEFIQEFALNDDYDGYIVNRLNPSSFGDVTDILNIFIISRLANTSVIQTIIGGGGANIFTYFNRRSRLTVDGDYAQLISINSEVGVNEFDSANYPDNPPNNPVFFNAGDVSDGVIGIFFSSDTQLRDYVTPKRTIINPNLPVTSTCAFNNIPVFSQEVPLYGWNVDTNTQEDSIFGSQNNTWFTDRLSASLGYHTSKYQSLDRILANSRYFRTSNASQTNYFKGYIYAVDSFGAIDPGVSPSSLAVWSQNTPQARIVTVGAPFHFYFGLKKGKSAFDRFGRQWLNFEDIIE